MNLLRFFLCDVCKENMPCYSGAVIPDCPVCSSISRKYKMREANMMETLLLNILNTQESSNADE